MLVFEKIFLSLCHVWSKLSIELFSMDSTNLWEPYNLSIKFVKLKSSWCVFDINKIFHFARADLLFIKKYLGVEVKNVNCTKIMSKIARSYSDKHGLKDLIKEFIGVDVSKQLQSSDFGGELSDKQLKYCAQDVIYLH